MPALLVGKLSSLAATFSSDARHINISDRPALLGVCSPEPIHARNPARFTSLSMLQKRLDVIRVPAFELEDATFETARQRIENLSSELGFPGARIRVEGDPSRIAGFKPQVIPAPKVRSDEVDARLFSIQLRNLPLWECLYYVAGLWEYDISVRKGVLILFPRDMGTPEPLTTKEYLNAGPIMFPGGLLPEKYLRQKKIDVREEISKEGRVHFYKGGFADFYPKERKLVIRTTQKQHLNFEVEWLPTCVLPENWNTKRK